MVAPILGDAHVVGLDVPMQDLELMQVAQGEGHLSHEPHCRILGQPLLLGKHLVQVAAVYAFHNDVQLPGFHIPKVAPHSSHKCGASGSTSLGGNRYGDKRNSHIAATIVSPVSPICPKQ